MSAGRQHAVQTARDPRGAAVRAATTVTVWPLSQTEAPGPRVEVQVTPEDLLFALQLITEKSGACAGSEAVGIHSAVPWALGCL